MPKRALLTVALLLCTAPAAAQSVKAGIDAWQRGDHAAAVSIWRTLAEQGDADASFNLGQAYRLGRGVPLNLGAAQTWLERAARKNHVDAQTTLGLLLFHNGNRVSGLRWLKAAAERGEPRAMLMFGTALFNGDGVQPDPVLAYAYVSRAAAQGLPAAKATLEEMNALLPLEQRKQGVAVALERAQASAGSRASSAAKPANPPVAAAQKPSAPAAPTAAAARGWRIQLGAFSRRSAAEALFKRLSSRPPLAGRQPILVPAGSVTRLQVGPFESRAAAAAACASLQAKGEACFPVAPK